MDRNNMEILLEDIRGKFDLVLEGYAALNAKIDEHHRQSNEKHDLTAFQLYALKDRIDSVEERLSVRIDAVEQGLSARIDSVEQNLSAKIDAVAANLSAHRADTEAHRNYLVRE
jgi:hypothetical protein